MQSCRFNLLIVPSFVLVVLGLVALSGCRDRKDDTAPAQATAPTTTSNEEGKSAAHGTDDDKLIDSDDANSANDLSAHVTQVSRSRDSHWGHGHQVSFFVEIDRKTESGVVPVEDPALLYASLVDPESGELHARGMCDRPRRPHECSFDGEHFDNGAPGTMVLEVTETKGGPTGTLALSIPPVPGRGAPDVIDTLVSEDEPRKYGVTFQDTGATRFDFTVVFFRGTYSDGNPFVDVDVATLERNDSGELELTGPERGIKEYGYTVTLETAGEEVTILAEGGEEIEESIERMAVCGQDTVPADGNKPKGNVRECAFREFGETQ